MPIAAQAIIRRCVETLQDQTSVTWPVAELVRYLNDGQREIILQRPDASVTSASLTLAAGAKQTLPANGTKLIEVVRNTAGTRGGVRLVSRDLLDRQMRGWQSITGVTDILHYMYDVRDPKTFYVYPPAAASGASVEIIYSALPTDVTEPADGATFTAVTGNISVPDIFGNALADYILFRAYSKDSEDAGNAQRSQGHYTLFANSIGMELKATVSVGPSNAGSQDPSPAA